MNITSIISKAIADLGEPIVVSYDIDEVRDRVTGEITTPASTVEIDGFGVPSSYDSSDIDGSVIQVDDMRLTIQKISTRPKKGWNCTVDGKKYRIINARNVRMLSSDVVYILQLRV